MTTVVCQLVDELVKKELQWSLGQWGLGLGLAALPLLTSCMQGKTSQASLAWLAT